MLVHFFGLDVVIGEQLTLLGAALLGLASTLHCWGMCGGVVAAVSLNTSAEIRAKPARLRRFSIWHNLGRVGSYTLLGALCGRIGETLGVERHLLAHELLRTLALLMLLMSGFALLAPWSWLRTPERIGLPLWRLVQRFTTRFVPFDRDGKIFVLGLIWGLLPCGLVYSLLLISAARASALTGAGLMFSFGAGTLPGMLVASHLLGRAPRRFSAPALRVTVGVLMIGLSLMWYSFAPQHGNHDHSDPGGDNAVHQHATPEPAER